MRGFEANDAGMRRRAAYGDGEVAAETERRHARDGRRLSAARPAGRTLEISRVVYPSGKQVVGFGRVREFRKIRLRKQDRTGTL
jgi:hypothetical protein